MATFRLSVSGLAHEPSDHGAQTKQAHHANDPKRNHAVNAPDAEDVLFNVCEIQRKTQAGQNQNQQQPISASESHGGQHDVAEDPGGGDGHPAENWDVSVNAHLIENPAQHGKGTVIHDSTIPSLIDAARRIAVFAIMLAQGE